MSHQLDRTSHGRHDHAPGHHHHDGEHHGHHYGVIARLRHAASELFGGHSHDSADQIDDALEADSAGRRALWTSLALLALTALIQGVIVAFTGSVALLGDTLHNVADALTAVPLLIAFRLARRRPSARFTYGYGRAEDLAGVFVVVMIALSSAFAAYEAVTRLVDPRDVEHVWAVAIAGGVGFVGNEVVARYRIRVGRRIGSAALVADGLHARTDGFTSLAVVVGAGGVALGWQAADPIIGLVITVAILAVLRSAVTQVGARLMDAVDPEIVTQAREALGTVDEIAAVRDLRVRWLGHALRAEVDIVVDDHLSVAEAHAIAHHAEAHLLHYVPRLTAATIHVSPRGAHPA